MYAPQKPNLDEGRSKIDDCIREAYARAPCQLAATIR